MLNKVQYRRIASVSVSITSETVISFGVVSISVETENVVSAAVSAAAVTGKSGFGHYIQYAQAWTDRQVGAITRLCRPIDKRDKKSQC